MPSVRRALWLAVLLVATCVTPPDTDAPSDESTAPGSARVRVDVYGGFPGGAVEPPPSHLVVDVTALVGPAEPPASDADLQPLAQSLAEGVLAPLPGGGRATLHPFHRLRAAGSCPVRTGQTHGSDALAALRRGALAGDAARGAQVVLALNFADECLPPLCQTAQELTAAGAWLDIVQMGRGEPPACLKELPPPAPAEPAALASSLRAAERTFRVERLVARDTPGSLVARGRSGGAVGVEPGVHLVVIEGAADIVVGPFGVRAGQIVRVRVLDFPLSAPEDRSWTIEVTDVAS
jgi:hypothetical protein